MSVAKRLLHLALGKRLPSYDGTLHTTGLDASITIERDAYAIPSVRATTERDAWFGLGFCHGQDRAFQLELFVRITRGTLSEIVGEDGLAVDRLSRRIGFRRSGVAQAALMDDDVRVQTNAYVAGLLAGQRSGGRKLAHEFALLGTEPTPWDAGDVQGFLCVLCFALAANWDQELLRLCVVARDGEAALAKVDTRYLADHPVTAPPGAVALAESVGRELSALESVVGTVSGSNAWAVSGARSKSGRPLLANDPHLPNAVPANVYLARIACPAFTVVGGSFVGTPTIASGHNGFAAWGITAAHVDNTDLFLEQLSSDGKRVDDGGTWCDTRRTEETIRVKGRKQPVVETVLETPRGPIISDVLTEDDLGQGNALSMQATWLMARPQRGLFRVHDVQSFEAFRELFRKASTSGVSMVYADAGGDTGWCLGVDVPKRKKGDGRFPERGWDPEAGWEHELVPFDRIPQSKNAPEGFYCTSNNQPTRARTDESPSENESPYLGGDFLDGFRQATLTRVLSERSDWTVDAMARLQLDVSSEVWRRIRDRILGIHAAHPAAREALALLQSWDGDVASHSVGATIFELLVAELCTRIIRATAPKSADYLLGKGLTPALPYATILTRRTPHLVELLERSAPGYFESWDVEIEAALAAALRRAEAIAGPDRRRWAWGSIRPMSLHNPVGEKRPLDAIFNVGPLPGEGDANTVSQGQVDYRNPTASQTSVPLLRMVVDCGDFEASRFSLCGGQSGNPLSPHYADQIPVWRSGVGIPIPWSDEAWSRRVKHRLALDPKAGK